MGCIKRERKVLKLVYPGKHVEVYSEPITAAEIMRRNPRHCITRPDVFEFPWLVVKPESVLLPGNVFFIVPNHTLYNLLKTKGQSNQSFSLTQNQSPNNRLLSSYVWISSKLQTYKQYIRCVFTRKGKVGGSRKVKENLHDFNKMLLPLFFHSPFSQRDSNCQSKTMDPNVESVSKYEGGEGFQNQSQVEDTHHDAKEDQKNGQDIEIELPKKDFNIEFGNEQVTTLKSCLRRSDSIRKSLNLKVSFNIPIKKH